MHALIKAQADKDKREGKATFAIAMLPEFERLNKQTCPYCSGWGHAAKDCPTDAKIKHMRGGVREQNAALVSLRQAAVVEANMVDVTGFSFLRPTG